MTKEPVNEVVEQVYYQRPFLEVILSQLINSAPKSNFRFQFAGKQIRIRKLEFDKFRMINT